MKKSSKKFKVSTQKKNDKGFRVKTSGIDISEYQQNPIMLYMHQRPTGNRNEAGVIGNFVDLKKDGEILWGVPAFDDTDDYALKLYNKVENNVLRMCSAGLIPKKWGKDASGDIWLLESKLFEISLADVGSNSEAFSVDLYSEQNGEMVKLSVAQIKSNFNPDTNMKLITLSAEAVALGLSATLETETAVEAAVKQLVTLASEKEQKIVKLKGDLADANTAKKTAEDALEVLETETLAAENKAYVELAHKEGKFVKAEIPNYIALMGKAPEETKKIIDAMPANPSVMEQLKGGEGAENPMLKLSYDELDKQGKLETLKADFPDVFKEKFKAKWNKEYVG